MSIVSAEKNLLIAVRNRIRAALSLSGTECEIENDEMAPATVGRRYFVVMPGGLQRGPTHSTSGGVRDFIYGVNVAVVVRKTSTPRDRTRSLFLGNLNALNAEVEAIVNAIDWQYEVISTASAAILADTASVEGFIEPLKAMAVDAKPRVIGAEFFGGREGEAGLARTVHFHGARRITTKTGI